MLLYVTYSFSRLTCKRRVAYGTFGEWVTVMPVTFRNIISGDRQEVTVQPGQTVHQAVESAGLIAPGNQFSVRDKDGTIVDNEPVQQHEGKVLQIGPQGNVQGGRGE
jgi:hypothetical protein